MRFLALDTDLRGLKRQFIVEGEEELLSSCRHWFAFAGPLLWIVPLSLLFIGLWITATGMGMDLLTTTPFLYAWLIFALGMAIHGFIEWRYNALVVTTDKLVLIDHRFVFKQLIRPVPLEHIVTTQAGTQFLGIGNCGYVSLHLTEFSGGENRKLRLDRMPKPDVLAAAIENARVLKSQRMPVDKGTQEQTEKLIDVQQKEAHVPSGAAGAPPPPTPEPPAEHPDDAQAAQETNAPYVYDPDDPAVADEAGHMIATRTPKRATNAFEAR